MQWGAMEPPVRICLGVVLAASLLLFCTAVSGNRLPSNTTTSPLPRHALTRNRTNGLVRTNATQAKRIRRENDVLLNELLLPKDALSEDHTDKNAVYKPRGSSRYTKYPDRTFLRRVPTSTPVTTTTTKKTDKTNKTGKLIIVTPTPPVKKPAQIMDSMMRYKRKKLETTSSTTTTQTPLTEVVTVEEEELENSNEEFRNDEDSYEANISNYDSNFFTIPNYNDKLEYASKVPRVTESKNSTAFSLFSNYFPELSGSNVNEYNEEDKPYKSDKFFNFQDELTTPKNDFFDAIHKEISESIIKNVDSFKVKSEAQNASRLNIVKESIPKLKTNISVPTNKSTLVIKNTKEIRLLDNDNAGTNNQEFSDIHGTSIYYEMSVLSTETYNIDRETDDDCESDALSTTPSAKEENVGSKNVNDPASDSQNYLPYSTIPPHFFDIANPVSYSSHNAVTPTDRTTHTSNASRNKNYSKWLSSTGGKESINNVTPRSEEVSSRPYRGPPRRFHHTTPKNKPIWMAPRRNSTRYSYTRSTVPTTIFSEYFDIKDKVSTSTPKPRLSSKLSLTTVESELQTELDPVHQTEIVGANKVVHSKWILDNNAIPGLWKRGSVKFNQPTTTSTEEPAPDNKTNAFLEIPPTLTAWALASLRSPPTKSISPQKSVDENELQKVGDTTNKKETAITSTTPTNFALNNDILYEQMPETEQIDLPYRRTSTPQTNAYKPQNGNESKSEVPAESNIFFQSSSAALPNEETISETSEGYNKGLGNSANVPTEETTRGTSAEYNKGLGGSANHHTEETTRGSSAEYNKGLGGSANLPKEEATTVVREDNTDFTEPVEWATVPLEEAEDLIPPVDATKSIGFESITKLPTGLTTPHDDTYGSSKETVTEVPTTTDYKITTIRFSYNPAEMTEFSAPKLEYDSNQPTVVTNATRPIVFPTRTRMTTIKDEPITTYRPKYVSTTQMIQEPTTIVPESTSNLEVSSQVISDVTEIDVTKNRFVELTTEMPTEKPITTTVQDTIPPETATTEQTVTSTEEIATEINTETSEVTTGGINTSSNEGSSSEIETSTEIFSSSEENSNSNEVITKTPYPQPTTSLSDTIHSSSPSAASQDTVSTVEPMFKTEETTSPKSTSEAGKTTKTNDSGELTSTTEADTKSVNELEDLTSFSGGDMTTDASVRVLTEEASTGAAIAIAVSTIGVIALILLIGLLLVVRRRGRRGVYAQRCTPVSLDAYSLDSVSVVHRKGNHRMRASKRSYGNPAFDDEVTSHPMQYAALANFALDVESMTTEFAEIPSVSVRPDEVPPGCEDKNRYSNVLPLPATRVTLKRIGNDPTTEYINANFIAGPGNIRNYYIACQAPLQHTVMDFWRMVWEQNSRVIVMLTEYMENGVEKCYEYLPPSEVSDNMRSFGDFQVLLMKREQRDKYAVSSIQLINMTTRTWREITHLWYFWPAKGMPDDFDSVLDFLSEMRSYMKLAQTAKEYDEEGVEVIYGDQSRSSFHNLSKLKSDDNSSGNGVNVYSPSKAEEQLKRGNATNGTLGRMKAASEVEAVRPCVVVCSSGAGRSAALIAADICARALAAAAVDVPRVVREIRAQRPHSLSNKHHYIFLYKLLSEYGNKLIGSGVDTI